MPMSRKERTPCLVCGKEPARASYNFCSNQCGQDYLFQEYIARWKLGIENGLSSGTILSKYVRRYVLNKYNYACAECGWSKMHLVTGNIPVQVHHIDGNYMNTREDNLVCLCPNCHALTPNFAALNRGKGRPNRKD